MKKLYRFEVSYGRMGNLTGIFSADDADVKNLLGTSIYFGECLGKHSDVLLDLKSDDLTIMTDDQVFIKKFDELALATGINPFDYVDDDENLD